MKRSVFCALIAVLFLNGTELNAQVYPSSNICLVAHMEPEAGTGLRYSGCWGWYQASKNKEYALVQGTSGRLFFVDVTNPSLPVVRDTVTGASFINREVQTYQNYCYSVSGGGNNAVFQIIDMKFLPDSVHVVYSGKSYFLNAHTLFVDGNKLYTSSVTYTGAGNPLPTTYLNVYSLATPTAPVLLRTLNQDFTLADGVHDVFVRNDTVYASCRNQGLIVYKFNTPGNTFTQLGSLSAYPDAGYNHSSSLTSDGKTLVMCDEVPTALAIKNVNVQNLSNMSVTATYKPTNLSDFVAHNPYVKGNSLAFVSCYQDGLQIYNISNPQSPVLAGYFDTFPQGGANTGTYSGTDPYNGNWGAYPYLPSGIIIALDMTNGLFLLQSSLNPGLKESPKVSISEVAISPNPATTKINVQLLPVWGGKLEYELRDILGRTLVEGSEECYTNCKWQQSLDLSSLAKGVYTFHIKLNGDGFEKKVVVTE
jgi:choice-of-anchor B domain-containing protein